MNDTARGTEAAASPSAAFCYRLRVRYAECDAQKVVFNARYGDYVDLATTEYLRALGFGEELIDGRLDYQLVKQTTEWKAPARFDDVLCASVSTQQLGNTSFVLAVEFRRHGQVDLLARSETVYVMVSPTLTKMPLPPNFRSALTRGAPQIVVNHAG
ncbi:thioesterase family protein [uncultured Nevskia sp.]|uniref:acyl-CoA thioesterase n=1 Tax=uncultured Nevskia sp. TaxID=228950 RepID=UPI0025E6DDEF|nr:thioesterase family protein [uncultured Nevskia sp.]